jgi:pantoate--beta-alanine ligase
VSVAIARTIADVRAAVAGFRGEGDRVALVPTLGALHEGHRTLIRHAHTLADRVVVSIFVNPLQFGPTEDLDRYPRTPDEDLAAIEAEGADLLFAPSVAVMYPDGLTGTRVTAGPAASRFEGRTRPGHFDGVLTVVAKLLSIVQPDVALFGRKDAQQVFLVRRMVADLNLPVAIEVVDTVREADGLALSSRNRYLGPEDRAAARAIPRALEAAASAADRGVDPAIAAARSALAGEPRVRLDYLALVDPATFAPIDDGYRGAALALVAATVGTTRLIDNEVIHLG